VIDPGIGPGTVRRCLDEIQPHAYLGIGQSHVARQLFGWGNSCTKRLLTQGAALLDLGASLEQRPAVGKMKIAPPGSRRCTPRTPPRSSLRRAAQDPERKRCIPPRQPGSTGRTRPIYLRWLSRSAWIFHLAALCPSRPADGGHGHDLRYAFPDALAQVDSSHSWRRAEIALRRHPSFCFHPCWSSG
jgi:hypothetical protein